MLYFKMHFVFQKYKSFCIIFVEERLKILKFQAPQNLNLSLSASITFLLVTTP